MLLCDYEYVYIVIAVKCVSIQSLHLRKSPPKVVADSFRTLSERDEKCPACVNVNEGRESSWEAFLEAQ